MKLKFLYQITLFISTVLYLGCKQKENVLEKKDSFSYSITFDETNPKLAKIKASFVSKDSTLYMWWGASNLPKRWATFVHNLEVTNDKSGKSIKIEELEDAR